MTRHGSMLVMTTIMSDPVPNWCVWYIVTVGLCGVVNSSTCLPGAGRRSGGFLTLIIIKNDSGFLFFISTYSYKFAKECPGGPLS